MGSLSGEGEALDEALTPKEEALTLAMASEHRKIPNSGLDWISPGMEKTEARHSLVGRGKFTTLSSISRSDSGYPLFPKETSSQNCKGAPL